MGEDLRGNEAGFFHSGPPPGVYPLQRFFLVMGLWAAVIGGCLFMSPLAGLAVFILFGAAATLWRRDEPPILPFCVGLQWVSATTGYFYDLVSGEYPGLLVTGHLEKAVLLSLIGFVFLVAGVRAGCHLLPRRLAEAQHRLRSSTPQYDVRRLFWLVIGLYAINWVVGIQPMEIQFNAAQIIYRLLEFRGVFLFVLYLAIVQQQKGYKYGAVALLWVLIPSFSSVMSAAIGVFIPPLIAVLSEWRPWSKRARDRRRTTRMLWLAGGLATALVVMGLVWQGAVKHTWRSAVLSGAVVGSPIEKAGVFASTVQESTSDLDWGDAWDSLAARLSSGLGYFSHVLERVPEIIPFENGRLVRRALEHIFMPRLLFPDKPNLGADSWLVLQYAGLPAAGEEQATSVGLGYMAEFYIDYGVPGMFLPIFLYGLVVGLIYASLLLFSPSHNFFCGAVTVMLLQHFVSYEGEIAKLLGGLVQSFIIFSILLFVVGRWFHRKLVAGDQL